MVQRNIIDNLFINLAKWEGKIFEGSGGDSFITTIYSDAMLILPTLSEILANEVVTPWKELKTGDLAVYSCGENQFIGIVIGDLERQIAYVDPKTNIVKITYYDKDINNYNYINGIKVIFDANK